MSQIRDSHVLHVISNQMYDSRESNKSCPNPATGICACGIKQEKEQEKNKREIELEKPPAVQK